MPQQGVDCRTCWKNIPRVSFYFIILSTIVSAALLITCLVQTNFQQCEYSYYLNMTPYYVFEKGHVWRLLSCYLINNSFWAILYSGFGFFLYCQSYEKQVGSLRFALLILVSVLLNSIFLTIPSAFFGKIPTIKDSWSYFSEMWTFDVNVGTMPIMLLSLIFQTRVTKQKTMMCCCFNMPTWAYILIMWFSCQIMMYPPWYGIWYNIFPVVIGYAMPMKYIAFRHVQMEQVEHGRQMQQQQQPEPIKFTTMNSAAQKEAEIKKEKKKETFGRGGRTL
uniref:Transmembrane domain-containing protein n=1 Tax=Trepomonas sp. PC1 TaxID=1076344 RepID=A0A146K9U8_9EUKA|eukprot:JAP92505.1 Transmembrane domain-containing protein [Trepomonas sp. PC1]